MTWRPLGRGSWWRKTGLITKKMHPEERNSTVEGLEIVLSLRSFDMKKETLPRVVVPTNAEKSPPRGGSAAEATTLEASFYAFSKRRRDARGSHVTSGGRSQGVAEVT